MDDGNGRDQARFDSRLRQSILGDNHFVFSFISTLVHSHKKLIKSVDQPYHLIAMRFLVKCEKMKITY
jgi:hypothetical protein